jgi:acyl-CoA thioester hydrolase
VDLDRPYQGAFVGGTHHYALRVYYEDTDAAGIVYYANYLRFIERARSDMLRAIGVDQRAMLEAGGGAYAVARIEVDYRASARLDDAILVLSEVRSVRAAACIIHQTVMRGREILVDAVVTVAFVSPGGRPKRQPRDWVKAFERLIGEAPE